MYIIYIERETEREKRLYWKIIFTLEKNVKI